MTAPERHATAHAADSPTYGGPTESPLVQHRRHPQLHEAILDEPCLVVAVVLAQDGVRFTASATCRDELMEHVARYVSDNVGFQLWPADAREVCASLDDGELEAAIDRYFALVGGRWDKEWLVVTAVDPPTVRASEPAALRWIPADPEVASPG
jgi:hypothetical protein